MTDKIADPAWLATRFRIEALKQLSEDKKKEIEALEKAKQRELEEAEKLLETAIEQAKIDERLWRETDAKLVKEQHEKAQEDDLELRLNQEQFEHREDQHKHIEYQVLGAPQQRQDAQETRDLRNLYESVNPQAVNRLESMYGKTQWNTEEENLYQRVKEAAEGIKGRESFLGLGEDTMEILDSARGVLKRMGYKS